MDSRFDEVITTRDRLREVGCHQQPLNALNVINHIDDIYRSFVEAAPFVMIATKGADGLMDISPKGGAPGFVSVLDRKTLAIPERPGNNRLYTFENLLARPAVGLLFLIPGKGDTLRLSGTGTIIRDGALLQQSSGICPRAQLHLVVTVEEAFMHCPKCSLWSRIWEPEHWPDAQDVPNLAQAKAAHGAERPS